MTVTSVVFDLDDTLYEEKAAKVAGECAVAEAIAARFDLTTPAALSLFLTAKRSVQGRQDLGPARNDRGRWVERALADLGAHDDALASELIELYWTALLESVRPYADATIALPELASDYDLWVASNEHEAMRERKLAHLGIASYFKGAVSADGVGYEKPAPEFFTQVVATVGSAPDEVVFVGDNPWTDVAGACRAGLRCAYLRRGPYSHFTLDTIPGCEPTWTIEYLTELGAVLKVA